VASGDGVDAGCAWSESRGYLDGVVRDAGSKWLAGLVHFASSNCYGI